MWSMMIENLNAPITSGLGTVNFLAIKVHFRFVFVRKNMFSGTDLLDFLAKKN